MLKAIKYFQFYIGNYLVKYVGLQTCIALFPPEACLELVLNIFDNSSLSNIAERKCSASLSKMSSWYTFIPVLKLFGPKWIWVVLRKQPQMMSDGLIERREPFQTIHHNYLQLWRFSSQNNSAKNKKYLSILFFFDKPEILSLHW